MAREKRDMLVLILIIAVVLLLGVLVYIFLIQPALSGLVVQGYNKGQVDVVNAILTQIQNSGYVQIPAGENQSLVLIPYQQEQQTSAQTE